MNIRTRLLLVNGIPLIIFAIISMILTLSQFRSSLYTEKEAHLKSNALIALTIYSNRGYGDYRKNSDGNIWRGMNFNISEDSSIVDNIKEQMAVDITFYFEDKAVMTSIFDNEGNRCFDLPLDENIKTYTLGQGYQLWCKNIVINGQNCQAYVIPILQESDNSIIGAMVASQSVESFNNEINKYIVTTLLVMLLILVMVFFFIRRHVDLFSQQFSAVVDKSKQDLLTGLYNKISFEEEVNTFIKNKNPMDASIMLIFDFDNFKQINDTYGHQVGDDVLKAFSNILARNIKNKGIAGRIGGDEFMIFIPENALASVDDSEEIAQKILDELYVLKVRNITNFTCSIGIGIDSTGKCDFQNLYQIADNALYHAKEYGKACYFRLSSTQL